MATLHAPPNAVACSEPQSDEVPQSELYPTPSESLRTLPGASQLPRVTSSVSCVAEACHIEDVSLGCQIHSHPSDVRLSQNISGLSLEEYSNGQDERLEEGNTEGAEVPLEIGMKPIREAPMQAAGTDTGSTPIPQILTLEPPSPNLKHPEILAEVEAEMNWGSGGAKGLLEHGHGSYGPSAGTPLQTAEYPDAPSMNGDMPLAPLSDSATDEEVNGQSPFGDDDEVVDETDFYHDIFAGSTEQVQPESMFDTPQFERCGFEGIENSRESGFFDNHDVPKFGSQSGRPVQVENSERPHAEDMSVMPEIIRPELGASFFDNTGEGDGGDFFNCLAVGGGGGGSPDMTFSDHIKSPNAATSEAENKINDSVSHALGPTDGSSPPSSGHEVAFTVTSNDQSSPNAMGRGGNATDDLAAKWDAVLGDDLQGEDFLTDDEEGFPNSNDEGAEAPTLIEDGTQVTSNVLAQYPPATVLGGLSRYAPPNQYHAPYQQQQHYVTSGSSLGNATVFLPPTQQLTSPHAPTQSPLHSQPQNQFAPTLPFPPTKLATPPAIRKESFVDKKGGYQSPYDLPMDIVKKPPANKRTGPASGQPLMSPPSIAPPVRQSSLGAASAPPPIPTPFNPSTTTYSRPSSSSPVSGITGLAKPPASAPPKQSFFQELPVAKNKPNLRYQPSPGPSARSESADPQASIMFPPPLGSSPLGPVVPPVPVQLAATAPILPPQQMNPRYSPAVAPTTLNKQHTNDFTPPPVTPHVASSAFAAAATSHQMSPPQALPYQRISNIPAAGAGNRHPPQQPGATQYSPQRRVSGPQSLGREATGDNLQHSPTQSRSYSSDPHHMHSSRPGTAKSGNFSGIGVVKEEDEWAAQSETSRTSIESSPAAPAAHSNRYAPARVAATPPPAGSVKALTRAGTFSPPARSGSPMFSPTNMSQVQYLGRTASPETFQPPRRAQTQSPSTAMNGPMRAGSQTLFSQPPQPAPFVRPASAFATNYSTGGPVSPVEERNRSMSFGVTNFIPPADTSIIDPLNRWQGCPIFTWGMGGHVAIMYPRRAQRYTADMSFPMVKCSPGEVRLRNVKDILPLDSDLAKFPGPAYTGIKSASKGKKREVLAWMAEKIQSIERDTTAVLGDLERIRAQERVVLWKVMKVILESDGASDGSPEIEKKIRDILYNGPLDSMSASETSSLSMLGSTILPDNAVNSTADRADPEAMKTIQKHLLSGNRTDAVWHAVDKGLWSHAMLIAGTVSQDLWKQVVQDFVRNEVKTLGPGMQSLAVLYEIFGGNGEESVDELVPQSARMGHPMLTTFGSNQPANPLEGLDKWRETLALIISNRIPTDHTAIIALGKLLASYGRVEAAHVCYLFSRGLFTFTGPEDPNAMVSLFGCDHVASALDILKDTDALLLTEIYELALSLAPAPNPGPVIPHIQAYKLYHALILAENGYQAEAQKYCEAIGAVAKLSTKPSPYFHPPLFNALEELTGRLSQSPKEPGSGWLSKLSQDNISGSMWGAFSKFVAGEDNDSMASGMTRDSGLDVGPFSKINPSPGVSRTQSSADLYAVYSGYNPQGSDYNPATTYPPNPPPVNACSPYAPRTSTDQARPATNSSYAPLSGLYPTSYQPYDHQPSASYLNKQPDLNVPSPYMSQAGFDNKTSFESPKQPSYNEPSIPVGYEPPTSTSYEPPSNNSGYEPPSDDSTYKPNESNDNKDSGEEDNKRKPKKKSFMDDDGDDAAFLARAAALKKEEEKKKKKAEEEAKTTKGGQKGGWFSGWFGRKDQDGQGAGPVVAKLGEENSFYYDPDLKRWVNKKQAGADAPTPTAGTPPPPRRSSPSPSNIPASRPSSAASGAAPPKSLSIPLSRAASMPPTRPQSNLAGPPIASPFPPMPQHAAIEQLRPSTPGSPSTRALDSPENGSAAGQMEDSPAPPPPASAPPAGSGSVGIAPSSLPPLAARQKLVASASAPPTRPGTTTAGGTDLIDDLLGPPGLGRKVGGAKKKGGKSRYVDVMAKN